jgi:hypothetical protein
MPLLLEATNQLGWKQGNLIKPTLQDLEVSDTESKS